MKFDFVGRKREIEKMFSHIKDPKLLLKFIVVSNNLIEVCEESFNPDEKVHLIEDNVIVKNPYQIVNENLTTPGEIFKAHLNGDVCFFNPDCMKSCNRCDVITTLSCALGSKTGVECDKCNCNLLSNIGSIYSDLNGAHGGDDTGDILDRIIEVDRLLTVENLLGEHLHGDRGIHVGRIGAGGRFGIDRSEPSGIPKVGTLDNTRLNSIAHDGHYGEGCHRRVRGILNHPIRLPPPLQKR
jgi:hypothetical protein